MKKFYEKTRINDEKRRKEIELFISRFQGQSAPGQHGPIACQDPVENGKTAETRIDPDP